MSRTFMLRLFFGVLMCQAIYWLWVVMEPRIQHAPLPSLLFSAFGSWAHLFFFLAPGLLVGWLLGNRPFTIGFICETVSSLISTLLDLTNAVSPITLRYAVHTTNDALQDGLCVGLIAIAAHALRSNNSFKPTPHRGVSRVPTLR